MCDKPKRGPGRPSLEGCRRAQVTLDQETVEILEEVGPTRSEAIRYLAKLWKEERRWTGKTGV